MNERNELQEWIDSGSAATRKFIVIGKGKALHFGTGNDETLCGRLMIDSARYVGVHETEHTPCSACWRVMVSRLAADTNNSKGETMAEQTEQSTEAATIEQIEANIERAASLAEAENEEGLKELQQETEALISGLPQRGRITPEGAEAPITFAALKKMLRDRWREAAQAKPKAAPKATAPSTEVAPVKDYTDYEGIPELVALGVEKATEGVRLHIKTSTTAKDIAAIILDMWRRIPNKDGNPDIKGDSNAAKNASSAMYKAVGESLGADTNLDGFDVENAVKKLIRSVQTQRTDVRAEYLRGLDADSEEAAEERKHYAKILEGKPDDTPASVWVANHYGVGLKGEIEKSRERWHAAKELTQGAGAGEGAGEAEGEAEGEAAPEQTPDERVKAIVAKLKSDIGRAKVDDFEGASEETKEAVRGELEVLYKALKDMISATL